MKSYWVFLKYHDVRYINAIIDTIVVKLIQYKNIYNNSQNTKTYIQVMVLQNHTSFLQKENIAIKLKLRE